MKKYQVTSLIIFFIYILSPLSVFTQDVPVVPGNPPEGFVYQAEARDFKGKIIKNTTLNVKITILQNSRTGTNVWEGDYEVVTDKYGLFTLFVGEESASPDDFSTINWSMGPYFLNVQVDDKGSWVDMGTPQLLTVPFALYAKSAIESDPIFTSHPAWGIDYFNIGEWNTAYMWGDHSTIGYLTSYTETDHVFGGSAASSILQADITNWNSAFGWSNHADAGYLTSFTETDPDFGASPANEITGTNIGNWNITHSWGNHADAGYLTSSHPANGIIAGDIPNWNASFGWGDHSLAGYMMESDNLDWSNLTNVPAGFEDGVDDVVDADADMTNELITGASLNGTTLEITEAGGIKSVDLSSFLDNTDAQTLSLDGSSLVISGGNSVVLPQHWDLDAENQNITNLADPVSDQDAATKNYVDNNTGGGNAITYSVGDFAQGGVVFWVDETGENGLVCAKQDQSTGVRWYAGTYGYTQAKGDGPFSGEANTSIIIAAQVAIGDDGGTYAARICNELQITEGGKTYGDWYLPSKGELNLMYQNKSTITATAVANGGGSFAPDGYWSSTETVNNFSAWGQYFVDGPQYNDFKNYTRRVRAVRAF